MDQRDSVVFIYTGQSEMLSLVNHLFSIFLISFFQPLFLYMLRGADLFDLCFHESHEPFYKFYLLTVYDH